MLKIWNEKSIAFGLFRFIYYDNETEVNTTYEKPVNFIGTDSGKSVFISGKLVLLYTLGKIHFDRDTKHFWGKFPAEGFYM